MSTQSKKTRLQRLLEKDYIRQELADLAGTERSLLGNGIPWTLLPTDPHISDGLVDCNGNFLFDIHDLLSYLSSTCIGDSQSLFSKSLIAVEKDTTEKLPGSFDDGSKPLFDDPHEIETYFASMDTSDLVLLTVYLCVRSNLPLLYYVTGLHHLVALPNNFRPILKSLTGQGYINASTLSRPDLPIFGTPKIYYTITKDGLLYLRKKYPQLSFSDLSSGYTGSNKLLHSYHTTLTTLQIFTYLRHTKVSGLSVQYEAVLHSQTRAHIHGYEKKTVLNDVQCDSVLDYSNCKIAIEQDMSTEHFPQIIDKIQSYFSSGSIGYGTGYLLNTQNTCGILSCHVTTITGRTSVLKSTAPYNITHAYLNREFYYALAYRIAHSNPTFTCEGDDEWELQLTEFIAAACKMLGNTEKFSEDKDGFTKYDKRCDSSHLHMTLDCVKELLAFYHQLNPARFSLAVDALIAHSRYFNTSDEFLSSRAKSLETDLPFYNYHYCSTLQERTAYNRLYRIADYFVREVKNRKSVLRDDPAGTAIGQNLACIAQGFPFYVIPSLSLGKYLPCIINDPRYLENATSISALTLNVAECFDSINGCIIKRKYLSVAPGYAGSSDTLQGVFIDSLRGDHDLRIRNCAVPTGSHKGLTICLEFIFDACSWARTTMYCNVVSRRIELSKDPVCGQDYSKELKKNDRKIIVVCENKTQITRFAAVTDLYNQKDDVCSLSSPEEICYILYADLIAYATGTLSGKIPFYLCNGEVVRVNDTKKGEINDDTRIF